MLLSDITSITREESDYGNDFVFKVETKENTDFREHHIRGEKIENHDAGFTFLIPQSEKALAASVLEKLKSLTGK